MEVRGSRSLAYTAAGACRLWSESIALWARFGETQQLMLKWFPPVQGFLLPGAAHGLQLQNPRGMAEALTKFWSLHPIQW